MSLFAVPKKRTRYRSSTWRGSWPRPSKTRHRASTSPGDLLDDARWGDCFIAERGGSPAAYALACRSFEIHTGQRRLWLGDLYVRPEARRSGIGRTLIAAIARHALSLGCTAVYWELWRKNRVGESFYRELGAESAAEMSVLRLGAGRLAELAYERQRGA